MPLTAGVMNFLIFAALCLWFWKGPAASGENGFSWKRAGECAGLSLIMFVAFHAALAGLAWLHNFLFSSVLAMARYGLGIIQ